MSSDYTSRLRAELLRAGARQEARRRPLPRHALRTLRPLRPLRPVAAAAAVALVVIAVVLAMPGSRNDDKPVETAATARLTLRVAPAFSDQSADIVRTRLAAAGISPAFVSASSGGSLMIAVTPADRAAADALLAPGRFAMYDWEAGVLGPDGRPAPGDAEVTGAAPLTQAEAQERADRADDARILKAENGPGWYAFSGSAALTNASLASARVAVDPMTQDPIVELTLTGQGQRAFHDLTRAVAERGADLANGGDPLQTSHHFVIVVDDRIVSMPFIHWRETPDGIDGAQGAQIVVKTNEEARQLAAILNAGPLPAP